MFEFRMSNLNDLNSQAAFELRLLMLALRLLPYSRPAPSPALRPPLPPVLETRNRMLTKLTYYYYRRPNRVRAEIKALEVT